ncbi:uncharacterized protein LOC115995974 [Ipomoea triloba]|uniref:uncharacterized protein LOC115995974 n=1 Tax=Ipomoea triloba TaxID=35885 RepID=UPI00125E35B5|nr:uncharacterized protein LOC115995974 [Ipomoea triloba]
MSETVYMKQPPSYIDAQYPDHVCLLKRSLYGLKQASRAWFNRLHSFLLSVDSAYVYLLVYVDDILVMGSDLDLITSLLSKLSVAFKIRDLGEPGFFLGIETIKCVDGILLSQQRYMNDILKRAGMAECNALSTPILTSNSISFCTDLYENPTQYRSLAGALQYLTITHPDLSFVVNQLCQYIHAPTTSDWEQLKRVLRYVKGTVNFGLHIRKSSSREIHAFSDSDWDSCPQDQKSTSGAAMMCSLGQTLCLGSARNKELLPGPPLKLNIRL